MKRVKVLIPKDAAIHRTTDRVPVARADQTAREVYDAIRRDIPKYDEIHFIYVTDEENRLVGILSLKELLHLPHEAKIGSAAHRALHTVHLHSHQERAANLALRHNLKVVPVVDEKNRFLGTLTEDAILSILHKEMREDILRLSGVRPAHPDGDNILEIPLLQAVWHRLPWLLLGLGGGLITAHFIGFFENALQQNLILASFIPLVVYMSDAVGTQMEAFVIRDFALVQSLEFRRYFFKQFLIVLTIALIIGGALIFIGFFLYRNPSLFTVLGLSLIFAILSSVFTGLVIPFLFRQWGMDPANASGPIATILQDFISVVIYFGIASLILGI